MNAAETVLLLRKIRAYRPAQTFDDLTADAWHEALNDIRYTDASQAVADFARESSDWIDPALIRRRVHKIRQARLEAHPEPIPPPDLTPVQTIAWLRETRDRIANGEQIADDQRGELKPRPIIQALTSKGIPA